MGKKPTLSLTSFIRYCKGIANLLFWVVCACIHTHTSQNLWYLFAGDKTNSSFTFSLRYCKDIANLFLRYFGHNWLRRLKVILSTCWKLLCLLAGKKINLVPHVFLEILQRYANFLFWVLWAYLAMQTQNDSINLKKTTTFVYTP